MSIDKEFEKWIKKYVKENDNIDFDLIILEDMAEAWKASRIDTLKEIKSKLTNVKLSWTLYTLEYIDTELNKVE